MKAEHWGPKFILGEVELKMDINSKLILTTTFRIHPKILNLYLN
jgi:hypothetical protein